MRARAIVLWGLATIACVPSVRAPNAQLPTPSAPARDSAARSHPSADSTLAVPGPVGFVNDFADLLSPDSEAELERIVLEVRDKSRGEIAIVTLPSLGGRTPQELAMHIGNSWGVGYAGAPDDPRTNTAVVVLVAPKERQVRIELGIGAQAFISDAEATRISKLMAPCFAKGEFARGLRIGVSTLASAFARQFQFQITAPIDTDVAC
jgi:uncharacterized protein